MSTPGEPFPGSPARPAARPRRVGSSVQNVLCDNPGVLELDGTNTWVLSGDGASSVVVDPGPADHPGHLGVVAECAGRVSLVLITHGHQDHVAGADAFRARTGGAPVRAVDPALCRDAPPLVDEEVLELAGLSIRVLLTPGHTPDSACFLVEDGRERLLLTSDTILGEGTTLLGENDGALRDYLATLGRLLGVGSARLLPGHGPDHVDHLPVVSGYLAHRMQRLEQVRALLAAEGSAASDADAGAVAERIYTDLSPDLMGAATMSVRAQLAYLRAEEAAARP